MRIKFRFLFVLIVVLVPFCVFAQGWEELCPGIDYRYFRLENPVNDVFVTRMNRNNPRLIIDACLANGKICQPTCKGGNRKTISSQVSRYNGGFGPWGYETAKYRYEVIAAVNGNGFGNKNGYPDSAMAIGGAFIKRTFGSSAKENGGAMGFAYKMGATAEAPGIPCMAGTISLPADSKRNRISFKDGIWFPFHKINDNPIADGIILYTHHFGAKTLPTQNVMEVVVKIKDEAPLCILPLPRYITGHVTEIIKNSGGRTLIPFDSVVVAASGSFKNYLALKVPAPGEEMRFSVETRDNTGLDWTTMYCGIGPMWGVILRGGIKRETKSDSYHKAVHPRTAVAYNSEYIYFVVVDGRSKRSRGMTLSVLADFCRNTLDATDAVNNDGGGSSTMWVDGEVKNKPSDGTPRTVANGLMMIRLSPREISTSFKAGQTVFTKTPGDTIYIYTGPGMQFHPFRRLPDGEQILIAEHRLNGLRCQDREGKPAFWWNIRTQKGEQGWVNGYYLKTGSPKTGGGSVPVNKGANNQ